MLYLWHIYRLFFQGWNVVIYIQNFDLNYSASSVSSCSSIQVRG